MAERTAISERGILMQSAMVRATLADTKTQTRRALKRQPGGHHWATLPGYELRRLAPYVTVDGKVATRFSHHIPQNPHSDLDVWAICPYGQPGDRLWVREAFMHEPADYCWHASVSIPSRPANTVYRADFPGSKPGEGWKPSIHMPRKLSRITLEVTGVRVERLWDISDADVLAEGCDGYKLTYAKLWESINGPGSWDANPWVWVVEFRRVADGVPVDPKRLTEGCNS